MSKKKDSKRKHSLNIGLIYSKNEKKNYVTFSMYIELIVCYLSIVI